MGRKCCVPECHSNYETEDGYTTVFKFPTSPSRRQQWLRNVNRANFNPSSTAVVCIHHFEQHFIVREDSAVREDGTLLVCRRKKLTLTADAVPTKFEKAPSSAPIAKSFASTSKSSASELKNETKSNESGLFQVCENHFKPEDVKRETGAYDDKRGIYLSASLPRPVLTPDAVPCIFPKPSDKKPRRNGKRWIVPAEDSIGPSPEVPGLDSPSFPLDKKNKTMDPSMLPNSYTYEVIKYGEAIIIRSNLNSMEDINKWIHDYERITNTNWTVRKSYPKGLRILCSKHFVCHHNSYRKIDEALRRKGVGKNSDCKAYIKITIKLNTTNTRKKDQYIKEGLGAIIELNDVHNHSLDSAEVLRFLPADDCKETFLKYFSNGMGVTESCNYHEEMLSKQEDFDVRQLANCRINPTKGSVYYWHNEWRLKNLSPAEVIEVHFESDQFESRRADNRRLLKQNAEPSIFCKERIPKTRKISKHFPQTIAQFTRSKKKKKPASSSLKKGEQWKRKRFNPPSSHPETILPDAESSEMHAAPSAGSLLDSNIVIKQEIIETVDEVPTLDMDHFGSTFLQPEMIKQEKSETASTVPPNPSPIVNHSDEPMDGTSDLQSESYSIIRVGDSDMLLSTKALETAATYNIVNFSTSLPKTASSSCNAISANKRKTSDSKASSETLAPTSVDGKVKDQFDSYGEYIAAKLRKLDSKSCAYVQKAFGEIIFEAEMGKFLHRNDLPLTS